MSVTPASAPQRTSSSTPVRNTPAVNHPDAKALAEEFSAAARKGLLPAGERLGKDGKPVKIGPDGRPLPQPTGMAKALGNSTRGQDQLSELRREDSTALALMNQPGPGLATPMQAPAGASHVDPSAFAEMLTQIWTREQGKTAREVRVSFGDEAWPATGARLLRLEDGSLQVTVSMGRRDQTSDNLELLRERLNARGLNVADIAIEDAV